MRGSIRAEKRFIYPLFLEPVQKSSSVKLVKGFILKNPGVRAKDCGECRSQPQLLVLNYQDPSICLFGCYKKKCEKKLILVKT